MYHLPVLLDATVNGLNIDPAGVYVDVTFGGGGHSREILQRLGPKGILIAFDQDIDAQKNLPADEPRLLFVPANFNMLAKSLRALGYKKVDGILADLGVSSHQFDSPERGFSFRFEADLDMRMDQTEQELTAADVVNTYSVEQLQDVFSKYGEIRNSRTLAQAIVKYRAVQKIKTCEQLLYIAENNFIGNGKQNRYFAQLFQALRMEVNDEVKALTNFLGQATEVLKVGGRLSVLSYHSIEDRLVKNFMKHGAAEHTENPLDLYGGSKSPYKIITKKPVEPSEEEVEENPRARSARLRIAEKAD
jgi:16S rRNA (cytosine1402-N4)-methyltransferase